MAMKRLYFLVMNNCFAFLFVRLHYILTKLHLCAARSSIYLGRYSHFVTKVRSFVYAL